MQKEESSSPTQSQAARTPPEASTVSSYSIYHAKDNFMHIQANAYLSLSLSLSAQ